MSADNKDERGAMEMERRLDTAAADAAHDAGQMLTPRILRGSYVRFGRTLPSRDHQLGKQNDDTKMSASSGEQRKRSKHA